MNARPCLSVGLTLAPLVFSSSRSAGAVILVDSSGGGDTTGIQEGIDAASPGDTVLVRPGVYAVEESVTFRGKAITVRSESGAEETVITFAEIPPLVPLHRGVVRFGEGETERSVLEGFTLLGVGDTLRGSTGIVCTGSSPTLRSCTITGHPFGGFRCGNGGTPAVDTCTISENTALDDAGGVFCGDASPVFTGCVIRRNSVMTDRPVGGDGGGIHIRGSSSPSFIDCTITENSAPRGRGGGLYAAGSASPTLARCLIDGNTARIGGGLHWERDAVLILSACTLIGNSAEDGGALSFGEATAEVTNCVIAGNSGGAVSCAEGSASSFAHCTIAGNSATSRGGGFSLRLSSATLVECILWDNIGGSISLTAATIEATFSCIAGDERWPGTENINRDPLFVSSGLFDFDRFVSVEIEGDEHLLPSFVVESPDYRLRSESPAVDAGSSPPAALVDIEGNERPCWRGVDMGGYEYCGDTEPPARFVRGDCNGDGDTAGVTDAVFLLRHNFLGGRAPRCEAACDVNGNADISDVADAVYELIFKFLGGPHPVEPFPVCGPAGLPDGTALPCAEPPAACNP